MHYDLPLAELRGYHPDIPAPPSLETFWSRTLSECAGTPIDVEFQEIETPLTLIRTFDVPLDRLAVARNRGRHFTDRPPDVSDLVHRHEGNHHVVYFARNHLSDREESGQLVPSQMSGFRAIDEWERQPTFAPLCGRLRAKGRRPLKRTTPCGVLARDVPSGQF